MNTTLTTVLVNTPRDLWFNMIDIDAVVSYTKNSNLIITKNTKIKTTRKLH